MKENTPNIMIARKQRLVIIGRLTAPSYILILIFVFVVQMPADVCQKRRESCKQQIIAACSSPALSTSVKRASESYTLFIYIRRHYFTTSTSLPFVRRVCPAMTTSSPGLTPLKISYLVPMCLPSSTLLYDTLPFLYT